ncbi:MAG TPA: ankyrin repeat domain-containing protein [Candidatus Babeliales bacterium]|nr:ankyrin repeat domain-containing protein [Candidatus Babeliales bacterium]
MKAISVIRIFTLFLLLSTLYHSYTMDIEQASPSFFMFPDEIQKKIIVHTYEWQKDHINFRAIVDICASLQLTCKKCSSIEDLVMYFNFDDKNKDIFLMRAVQAGVPCLVQHAINKGAALNYIEKPLGYTPLSSAVRNNNFRSCALLLEAGANIHQKEEDIAKKDMRCERMHYPNNYQPIHCAAMGSNISIIELLIKYKANIEATDGQGDTPIVLATLKWKLASHPVINVLLSSGVKVPDWIAEKINLRNI